ncbi:transcription termination/antitermination protein NusG [Rhodoplanes roseus]|nr:transcription termination/antitermination NusG family protein [Rhodoplanes roseus]
MLAINDEDHRAVVGRAPMRSSPPCDEGQWSTDGGAFRAWVVALVEPQSEERARAWLWHQGRVPTWLPMMRQWRTHRGGGARQRITVDVPILRGYLFVPATYFEHALVLRSPGIHSFMMLGRRLVMISDPEMDRLRSAVAEINEHRAMGGRAGRPYKIGEAVRFIVDVWAGVVATVEGVDAHGRVVVDAGGLMGRIVVADDQIEPNA